MNCVKMRPASAKEKGCLLYFSPYTLLSTQEFESIPEKTSLGPERRLMLAVLEETAACAEVVSRNGGSRTRTGTLSYISTTRGFTVGLRPNHVSTRTQSFNLILNRRDRFQIICDGESVFPSHVFETMRRSLDDFGHEALDIIQVGLSPR